MFDRPKIAATLTLAALLIFAACLQAYSTSPPKGGKKTSSVIVTGCLRQGVVLDRFRLTGQDGKSYSLRSLLVKLSDYVGRSVAIKGELKRDRERDDYDFEGSEANEEYGKGKTADFVDVEVISLKVTSASCRLEPGR